MASLIPGPGGYRLQFSVAGNRRCVRLTGFGEDAAERAKHHVEVALRSHRRRQPIPVATLDWIFQSAPRGLLSALASVHVVDDRRMLGDALRAWITSKLHLSTKRIENMERMADSLTQLLGDVEMESITADQLAGWAEHLSESAMHNTVAGYAGLAKQFFQWAVRERLLLGSPAGQLSSRFVPSERLAEVPAAAVERLCEASPDAELAIALRLARWGGLRAAEILRVRVSDVDAEGRSIRVVDKKREHSGHGVRTVPIFPELECVIVAAHGRLPSPTRDGLLMPGLGSLTTSAMGQRADRLCESLGIAAWPRFWQNMRATRESELMDLFSLKDVCKWIGNSPAVAMRHYAMVRKQEFDRASGKAA